MDTPDESWEEFIIESILPLCCERGQYQLTGCKFTVKPSDKDPPGKKDNLSAIDTLHPTRLTPQGEDSLSTKDKMAGPKVPLYVKSPCGLCPFFGWWH